ncbi:MAG: restriction endonuclease subunit S, partial [Algoriphagus sp.]
HTRNIKFIDFEFAVGADGTKILKPKEENDPRFFFFYLKALRIPSFGYSRHFKVFEYLDLPIPPLPEQQRIVAKLDAIFGYLDVLNEKLERIPELLKNFRQQVLTQAVTGELTKEWREGNNIDFAFYKQIENYNLKKKKPVKARGQKGLDEKLSLFKLPKEWKWIPQLKIVKDGANSISAGPFGTIFKAKDFRDKGVPIIFLRHVKKEGFNQNKPKLMDEVVWEKFHKEYSVSGGELLVTKLGDPPGEATVYPKDIGIAMITPDVMKSDLNENFALPAYVSYFFNSSICKEFIANISFGMTRLRIDLTMFKSFPIPLPTIEEQTEIVKCVEVLFNLVDRIEDQFESLKSKIDQLPQAVLAKAFRGELVDQEVKEYVREVGELGMVAEGNFNK